MMKEYRADAYFDVIKRPVAKRIHVVSTFTLSGFADQSIGYRQYDGTITTDYILTLKEKQPIYEEPLETSPLDPVNDFSGWNYFILPRVELVRGDDGQVHYGDQSEFYSSLMKSSGTVSWNVYIVNPQGIGNTYSGTKTYNQTSWQSNYSNSFVNRIKYDNNNYRIADGIPIMAGPYPYEKIDFINYPPSVPGSKGLAQDAYRLCFGNSTYERKINHPQHYICTMSSNFEILPDEEPAA